METVVDNGNASLEATPKWPKCGDPKTPENTIVVGGKWEYCRKCYNAKAMERHYRRNPGARKRYFGSADEAIEHFIKRDGRHKHWNGPKRERGIAAITHDGKVIYVARYLWEKENGPTKPHHALYRTCEFDDCVSPECREERQRTVVCEPDVAAERTRSAFDSAVVAATRREGAHLFAIDGKPTVNVMGRSMDLRNLLWTRAGHKRDYRRPLSATCEYAHCLEPAHQREGVPDLLAQLQREDDHLIIPDGLDSQAARRAAWEESGEALPDGKALVPLCSRSDCAQPFHQMPWAVNKAVPTAVRASFLRVLLRKRTQRSKPLESSEHDSEAAVAYGDDEGASEPKDMSNPLDP